LPFRNKNVTFSVSGDRTFKLEEDLVYSGKDDTWTVPRGFTTDFASVPAAVQWLVPSYGRYTLAAVVHDYFCIELATRYKEKSDVIIIGFDAPNARDTDAIFRRIMRELEVPFLRRWTMWTGVRWGAMLNPARRAGILNDIPLMLVWSILVAPVVLPVSLLVAIGLGVDRLFELIVGRFLK
jgi:hypothetical protein